jgi:hypothetical protein
VVNQLTNKTANKILYFFLLLLSFPFGIANIISIYIPISSIITISLFLLLFEAALIYLNVYINFSKKERSIDKAFWFYIFFNLITNLLFIILGIFYVGSGLSI